MPRRISVQRKPSLGGFPSLAVTAVTLALAAVQPVPVEAQSGVIEGRVDLEQQAPRRSASRYPAGGRRGATAVQSVPAIVYLMGAIPGGSSALTAKMVQRDTAFAPAALVVAVGATVDFPNEDPFFHNVFSYSSTHRFDLGRYPQGESKAVTFDQPGIVEVYCEVHDPMRAAVLVVENPFHAIVAADGSFRIEDVPPGEHTVAFWSADHKDTAEETVTVTAGGTTTVEVELRR